MRIKRIPHRAHMLEAQTHRNGVTTLHFPGFDRKGGVISAFSTRLGGVSGGCWSTMNLSFTRGDDPLAVHENFRLMAEVCQATPENVVCTWQTHTANIRVVTARDRGKGVIRERDYRDIDGLITDDPSVVLTVFYADCVPIFFADPVRHVIGTAHAGWRGTVAGIGPAMVGALCDTFHSSPADLLIAIGPSICAGCYEIGEDVAAQVRSRVKAAYAEQVLFRRDAAPAGKYQLDLHTLNTLLLCDAGVPAEQIFITDICTKCNPSLLFSHRVMGEQRGNAAGFLRLLP